VPVGVPNQVDRAFPHASPVKYLHRILHDVDFPQRAERNQVPAGVILQPDDSVAVTSGIEAFAESGRQAASSCGFNLSRLGRITARNPRCAYAAWLTFSECFNLTCVRNAL
jgi:hypothetical protein